MPQELWDALLSRNLPTWAFVGAGVLYWFSTSQLAAKLPGGLGVLARKFERRAIEAAEREREQASVSSAHYEDEIKRMDALLTRFSDKLDDAVKRIEVLETENRRVRGALASAIAFIQTLLVELRGMGLDRTQQIPDDIRSYFGELETGEAT